MALYGLDSPDEDLQRIEKVSVEDVNRVARKYLDLAHAVSAVMIPQGGGRPVAVGGGFGGQENISLGEAHATAAAGMGARGARTPRGQAIEPASGGQHVAERPDAHRADRGCQRHGQRVRAHPQPSRGRGRVAQQGVGQLLDPLLSYGSEQLDRLAFQGALDEIGADEHAGTDFDVQVLAQNFDRGVALLADNELHPALPAAAMNVVSKQLAQVVAARIHSPGYLAQRSLRSALFPAR